MGEDRTVCVGLDTHKARIAVAVAEPGRAGEVRFQGEIANQADAVRRLIERLADKHGRLKVCYEAGPCGYGLQRQVTALGHDCTVVAPSPLVRTGTVSTSSMSRSVAVSLISFLAAEMRTLDRMGMVLRRSTTLATWASALASPGLSMVSRMVPDPKKK